MTEMYLRNAIKVSGDGHFSPDAVSVKLEITITPSDGAALVYTSKTGDHPIRFNGPVTTADVPIEGTDFYLQLVSGAKTYEVKIVEWTER